MDVFMALINLVDAHPELGTGVIVLMAVVMVGHMNH